jgi:hypothetical protein
MASRQRLAHLFLMLLVFNLFAVLVQADEKKSRPRKRKDYAGTSLIMGDLRVLFAKWDANHDGYLDPLELASAFRGSNAPAYRPAIPAGQVDFSKYPDYQFLIRLDQNHDGKISQDEYEDWAREYARELKGSRSRSAKTAGKSPSSAKSVDKHSQADEKKMLAEEARLQKQALAAQQKEERYYLEAIKKALPHSRR